MRMFFALMVIIGVYACTAIPPSNVSPGHPDSTARASAENQPVVSKPAKPAKSPHGYIITKDYEPGRFGGFVGDCTDDKNWPYYWQCMSENAGNGRLK